MTSITKFDEEEQHYLRILNNLISCQERSDNDSGLIDLYVSQEISALMHELKGIAPESHLFAARWTLVRNSIILLQSSAHNCHDPAPTTFYKLPLPEQTQIQEIMGVYLA